MKSLHAFLVKYRRLLLHVCAALVVAASCWLAYFQSVMAGLAQGIARQVVSSPALQLVMAAQGKSAEIAAWQREHPQLAQVHWLQSNPEPVVVGIAAALLLEAMAWRVARAS